MKEKTKVTQNKMEADVKMTENYLKGFATYPP